MADDTRALRRDLTRLQLQLRQLADTLTNLAAGTTTTQRAGATLGGLSVGNTDITITWPRPWPDTTYAVIPTIVSGTGALGSLDATLKAGSKTITDCVVTVANTGLLAVGQFAVDCIGMRV